MAYNVAANMQFAKPVSAALDARDNVLRNALNERQVSNVEQNTAFQQQRLSATDQIAAEQRAKQAEQDDATKLHTAMQYLSQVQDPVQFNSTAQRMLQHPEIGRILQSNGVTMEDITPQNVQELLAATGAQTGNGPAIPFDQSPDAQKLKLQGEQAMALERQRAGSAANLESLRYENDRKLAEIKAKIDAGAPVPPTDLAKIEGQLRGEYTNNSKVFTDTAASYQRIRDSASDPSAAGDLALIFNYMKVLDPGSTVREGEFATAQNSGSIPSRIWASYNKVMSGERLAPAQREDFFKRATTLYKGQEARHKSTVYDRYTKLAQQYGVRPENVVNDLNASTDALQNASAASDMKLPSQLSNGWTLHEDAAGNKAYVSPDGKQFKEVH